MKTSLLPPLGRYAARGMGANYLKIAWRALMNNKVFSFINVFGLAAGLASCMLICLYIYDELSYDTNHPNGKNTYQVGTVFIRPGEERKAPSTPAGLAAAMRQEFPEVVNTTRIASLFVDDKTLLTYKDKQISKAFYETKGYLADPSVFSFFDYPFLEGDKKTALTNPFSMVISEEIARKIFGSQSPIGQRLLVESNTNGSATFTVMGVFRPSPTPTHIDARFFLSIPGGGIDGYLKSQTSMAGNNFFYSYVQLQDGTNPAVLEAKFPAFVEKYMGKDLKQAGMDKRQFLLPVRDIHLRSGMPENVTTNGSMTYLYILLSIALFTLLIACINFMNLSTARSAKRSGEVGIRKVLGVQRQGLIYQFLGESILLSTLAFVVSMAIVWLLSPIFSDITDKKFAFTLPQYLGLFASFFALSLVAGLLAGSYPAFYLSSFQPIKVLKGQLSNTLAAVALRKGLVVFQFTISCLLIVASVVISNQMNFMRTSDLGFTKDQQIIIPMRSEASKLNYAALKNSLMQSNIIQSVGAAAYYPGIFNPEDANFYKEGQTAVSAKHTYTNRVDFDFLKTLNIQTLAGRSFSVDFLADTSTTNIIFNETAIRAFGFASPAEAIGKKVFAQRQSGVVDLTIVGVVKDFHFEDLKKPITPFGFTVSQQPFYNYLVAHANTADFSKIVKTAETAWQKLNPNEPFEYSFLEGDFQKNYQTESRLATIVNYFTLIAILISCLGLFGLASFSAEQRTKEIGVRKVLGASVGDLIGLLSKDFLKLVIVAVIVASPLAWFAMNRWLENFAYRQAIDWKVFALTAFVALLITLLTVSYQAIRAALMNPVKSLKTE